MEGMGSNNQERGFQSAAARAHAFEHQDQMEDTINVLEAQIKELDQRVKAGYEDLERGRSYKAGLTEPKMIEAAEKAEEAKLQEIVRFENEKAEVEEKLAGKQRSPLN